VPEAPESVAVMTQSVPAEGSSQRVAIPRPPRSSWTTLGEHGASNESSAWIPAVRPSKEDEGDDAHRASGKSAARRRRDGPERRRKVDGAPRARGPRLLLHRQPAHGARASSRRAVRARRDDASGARDRRARARLLGRDGKRPRDARERRAARGAGDLPPRARRDAPPRPPPDAPPPPPPPPRARRQRGRAPP